MKRITTIILMLCMVTTCFASCNSKKNSDVPSGVNQNNKQTIQENQKPFEIPPPVYAEPGELEANAIYAVRAFSDGATGTSYTGIRLPKEWMKTAPYSYTVKDTPKTVTVDVLGQKHTYEYSESFEYALYKFSKGNLTHVYGDHTNGNVEIEADSGKVVSWVAPALPASEIGNLIKTDGNSNRIYDIPMSEVEKIAREYATELVGAEQLSKYEMFVEGGSISFYRIINGEKTNESISISLYSNGDLHCFYMYNIGLYNDVSDFEFDADKAKALVLEKIGENFQETPHKIERSEVQIIRLPSGQIAYDYTITVQYRQHVEKDENGKVISSAWGGETLEFVIPAE